MWAFTGGCHYDEECGKYINNCGHCPLLNSNKQKDLSYKTWRRKKKSWKNLDLTVVTPSSWLGECAKKSSLFHKTRIEVIPNGIDLNRFKPIDKNTAKDILCLPNDPEKRCTFAFRSDGECILRGSDYVFSFHDPGFQTSQHHFLADGGSFHGRYETCRNSCCNTLTLFFSCFLAFQPNESASHGKGNGTDTGGKHKGYNVYAFSGDYFTVHPL